MKENGHEWIDILKMDIESSEFAVIGGTTKVFAVLPFSQLQIELHLAGDMDDKNSESFGKFLAWFEKMEKLHLRPFWNEINLIPLLGALTAWEWSNTALSVLMEIITSSGIKGKVAREKGGK